MPWNRKLYPKDWPQIRASILTRAGNRCERCGAVNHAFGYRDRERAEFVEVEFGGTNHAMAEMEGGRRCVRIVLTIAHVHNPDPMDCRPENLQALCQRCHNRLDAPMRARHAGATRDRKRGQMRLGEAFA